MIPTVCKIMPDSSYRACWSVISQLAKSKEIFSLHQGRPAVPAVIAGMQVTEEVSALAGHVGTRKDRGLVSNIRIG